MFWRVAAWWEGGRGRGRQTHRGTGGCSIYVWCKRSDIERVGVVQTGKPSNHYRTDRQGVKLFVLSGTLGGWVNRRRVNE